MSKKQDINLLGSDNIILKHSYMRRWWITKYYDHKYRDLVRSGKKENNN
jgi:hypothetical protein